MRPAEAEQVKLSTPRIDDDYKDQCILFRDVICSDPLNKIYINMSRDDRKQNAKHTRIE